MDPAGGACSAPQTLAGFGEGKKWGTEGSDNEFEGNW